MNDDIQDLLTRWYDGSRRGGICYSFEGGKTKTSVMPNEASWDDPATQGLIDALHERGWGTEIVELDGGWKVIELIPPNYQEAMQGERKAVGEMTLQELEAEFREWEQNPPQDPQEAQRRCEVTAELTRRDHEQAIPESEAASWPTVRPNVQLRLF
jgi:hypothetical protein